MAPIVIVPGKNPVLNYVSRLLEDQPDVHVMASANDVLWQARQTPPTTVLSDAELSDMSGAELAEILPNFAPDARIVVCGPFGAAIEEQVRALGAEYLPLESSATAAVRSVYAALDREPPAVLPPTGELHQLPPAAAKSPAAGTPVAPAASPRPMPQQEPAAATQPASTRAASPKPATPAARPATPPTQPTPDSRAGATTLVIQPQQHQQLTQLLAVVAKEVGAQSVLLIDAAGMVLVQSGSLPVVMELVGPMLATSFSTTGQLARLLQEQHTSAAYVHEGDRHDIYAFNVAQRVSLIVMFDKRVSSGQLGTVWIYARRAIKQLQQVLRL